MMTCNASKARPGTLRSPSVGRRPRPWILIALLWLTGCALHMDAPDSYLELETPVWPYEYQAASSDDCRLAAREVPNPKEGGLQFWSKAIQNHMVLAKGYTLVSRQEAKTKGGWVGEELLFSTHSRGLEYYFLLTFFPVGTKIYLAEAGGERALVENDLKALRKAIVTLR